MRGSFYFVDTMIMKRVLLAAILVSLLSSPAHCRGKMEERQLGSRSPNFAYVNDNPFAAIASTIRKDKKSPRFRVSWVEMLGSGWNKGTMLYDRKKRTLKYYDMGGEGEERKKYYRRYYLFRKFKDDTFFNLVKTFNNQKRIGQLLPTAFIDLLPKRGYRRFKFADYNKGSSAY